MSNYTIEARLFATYYDTALLSTFGTCTQLFLFGNLLVLLLNTTYLLHTPIRASRSWLVAPSPCFTGGFFYLEVQGDAARASSMLSRAVDLDVVGDSFLVANNILTDGLFLHRCYVIWGRNMKVVIIPALSLIVAAVIGFIGASTPDEVDDLDNHEFRLTFGMIILTNLMLMALTAGRIWWIRRDVVSALEPSTTRVYGTIIAMILESGAIYCISILLYLISVVRLNQQDSLLAISVFRGAIPQIMSALAAASVTKPVHIGYGSLAVGPTTA
ncbi:hypothetical protein B0H14DRAFT_3465819 [Mycena olivaceomarginata]|nr:hypothetical protein B0H14DRAFT_3465819 [Mycena olivaceomarginata]